MHGRVEAARVRGQIQVIEAPPGTVPHLPWEVVVAVDERRRGQDATGALQQRIGRTRGGAPRENEAKAKYDDALEHGQHLRERAHH
ncbi:MAG: hypothetical protein AMXMBFR64_20530 [Myxococcales bacterium]